MGRPISHLSAGRETAATIGSVNPRPTSHLSRVHPTALPSSAHIWTCIRTISAAHWLCRHHPVSDGPPNLSPFGARKAIAIMGLVSPCPRSHLSHTRSISRVRRRPFLHLCRPITSLLTARNLTRLRPIPHATRPFSHFPIRKPLKINADLPPESESELNRTLEGKSRSPAARGYVGNRLSPASLALGKADAKPLPRFCDADLPSPCVRAHALTPPPLQADNRQRPIESRI